MWWYGRGNSSGAWLPEEKKANMWYGRGNSGGSWLPEEKNANRWYGMGNSGGSWPPAFPRSFHSSSSKVLNDLSFFLMASKLAKISEYQMPNDQKSLNVKKNVR